MKPNCQQVNLVHSLSHLRCVFPNGQVHIHSLYTLYEALFWGQEVDVS